MTIFWVIPHLRQRLPHSLWASSPPISRQIVYSAGAGAPCLENMLVLYVHKHLIPHIVALPVCMRI